MYNLVIAHLEEELAENIRAEHAAAVARLDGAAAAHYRAQIAQFEAAIALLRAQPAV